MANGQISNLLEFANMQMAAEAFLSRVDDAIPNRPRNEDVLPRLITGNNHASFFTTVQADAFTNPTNGYEVVTQYRNDPLKTEGYGFSATLFKKRGSEEYTLSFRSVEFIDDAVRDSKSTSQFEIKDLGWAFGQIAEMEAWYKDTLVGLSGPLVGKNFTVTGYSLGGHLATAFNILRREEAEAIGTGSPVIQTYTFNGAGTGEILNNRRLTDLISDFEQIRSNYLASPQWNALTETERSSIRSRAQTRVALIEAEYARVSGLSGTANPLFGNGKAPKGGQASLGYQIAELLVARNTTVGASNFPFPGGVNYLPTQPVFAPESMRFSNMTEVVGMETGGVATSFISNSGLHYGARQEIHIEDQPRTRGVYSLLLNQADLVSNPARNDFGDTHSLVLLVDSLSLMAVMEKLAPNLTIETAGRIFAAMSNAAADTNFGTQGRAEGDTLERMLDALRKLVLGPNQTPTLNTEQMRQVLDGNTWHVRDFRTSFHQKLALLNGEIQARALAGTLTIDNIVGIAVTDLSNIAQGSEAVAYRYALKELNPFALLGENNALYARYRAGESEAGSLDLYDPVNRSGTLTTQWLVDRAQMLAFLNTAYTNNTNAFGSNQVNGQDRFTDLTKGADCTINGVGVIFN